MKINFKGALQSIVAPLLMDYGYELIDLEETLGARSFFFRKKLWGDMFSFIEFHQMRWAPVPEEQVASQMPRKFSVRLWRNPGNKPRSLHEEAIQPTSEWLYVPLSYLIWQIYNDKVYSSPYHDWSYTSSENLDIQMQDASRSARVFHLAEFCFKENLLAVTIALLGQEHCFVVK